MIHSAFWQPETSNVVRLLIILSTLSKLLCVSDILNDCSGHFQGSNIVFFALLNLVPNSAFEKQQQQKRLALIKGLLIDAP